MKIRASKKYIQGIDKLVNNAQKIAEDVVNLPEGEIDYTHTHYRYRLKFKRR